jgi:hypothetical protein
MPTIEDFFIKEYERVVAENNELKKRLSDIESSGETFGVFDLRQPKDIVRVDIEGSAYFWQKTQLNKEQLRELINLSKDDFVNKCQKIKREDCYFSGTALKINEERYRYSISVRDMDGTHEYAFDNTKSPDLVDLRSEPDLSVWVEACYLDQVLNIAAQQLREDIAKRIEDIEQEEAEAGENDANE